MYTVKMKTLNRKAIYTTVFTVAQFTVAKTWKKLKYPQIGEQIKTDAISAINKNEIALLFQPGWAQR